MNGLDLVLVIGAVAAATGGWRMGFLRRLAGWGGAAVGSVAAVAITPPILRQVHFSNDVMVLVFGAAMIILLASLGQGLGLMMGSKARLAVGSTTGSHLDSFGGAALGIAGVGVLAWLILPVMTETSGWPAASSRGSVLARVVTDHLPDPPSQITQIERELAGGALPKVFAGLREAPRLQDPPADSPIDSVALERFSRSVVRVEAPACRRLQTGSGFFLGDGLVVTNAHVVAGSDTVSLDDSDGDRHSGEVIHFDPEVDLAIISTDFDRPALPLADAAVDDSGLVLGFPGGGPLEPSTFAVGEQLDATGYDIYDSELVTRDLLVLASALQPGDSGSAVIRSDGSIIGVAVAIAPDREFVAYALTSAELRQVVEVADPSSADTGRCL